MTLKEFEKKEKSKWQPLDLESRRSAKRTEDDRSAAEYSAAGGSNLSNTRAKLCGARKELFRD